MSTDPKRIARRITDRLLVNHFGEKGVRVEIKTEEERDLGGWCRESIERIIIEELEKRHDHR